MAMSVLCKRDMSLSPPPFVSRPATRYSTGLSAPGAVPAPNHNSKRLQLRALLPPLHDMPRATHPGPAALRNRNRVTNKTRLKVIQDTIDADSIVLDEDEEKARVVSTAGVDAEDANEHHLQAVLSAAASRHQATARSSRSNDKEKDSAPAAYIPTPDSTGVVQHYEELYAPGRWKDTSSYTKSSDTVEEATSFALANGFIYYMDERDKEWLDKNNEQARGEGMSSQVATSSSNTRSGRSAKAKGKEPDVVPVTSITEDDFELVMAIFEKVTHEKTEFLHHGLEQGALFPPFSDYHDAFASPLRPDMFAIYSVPPWIPPSSQLLRYARIIYPHWRERRLERDGHRIIPTVNLDESDTNNESYICFRRREIKAIRKTRASQASYSERMVRLQNEIATTLDIVRLVQSRECLKREAHGQSNEVWAKRRTLADLKRARPSLGTKEDDELFLDKEKPPKKPKLETNRPTHIKIRTRENGDTGSPVALPQLAIRPKEKLAAIYAQVEQDMQRCKERDSKWEDASDYPYQSFPVSYGCRLFKTVPLRSSSVSLVPSHHVSTPPNRSGRLRHARGGRLALDRRVNWTLRSATFDGDDNVMKERLSKVEERFRFDDDDGPSGAPDEQCRKLIDERHTRNTLVAMTLFDNEDLTTISTDQTLKFGSMEVKPYHLGPLPNAMRPPAPVALRQPSGAPAPPVSSSSSPQALSVNLSNGTPVSIPTHVKKLAPPNSLAHLRISNGGLRVVAGTMPNGTQHPTSPNPTTPLSASTMAFGEVQGSPPKLSEQPDSKTTVQGSPNGVSVQMDAPALMTSPSPTPSKPLSSATANVNLPNGYLIPTVNGYPSITKTGYMHPSMRHNGLSMQQVQSLSTILPDNAVNSALRQPGAFVMSNGAYPMQMSGARPMQWPMTGQHSPPTSVEGGNAQSPAGSPGRTSSANGMRVPQMTRGTPMPAAAQQVSQASIARLPPHSPTPHILSPNVPTAAQVNAHTSPTRTPQPPIPTPSPSLQSRQIVGGSGAAGY